MNRLALVSSETQPSMTGGPARPGTVTLPAEALARLERLATASVLSSGLAHEIANPLSCLNAAVTEHEPLGETALDRGQAAGVERRELARVQHDLYARGRGVDDLLAQEALGVPAEEPALQPQDDTRLLALVVDAETHRPAGLQCSRRSRSRFTPLAAELDRSLIASSGGELCSPQLIAGGFGNPARVPEVLVRFV